MKLVVVAVVLMLTGCATPGPVVEAFTTPDGQAGHTVYCGGIYQTMSDCHAAARQTCGGNYKVVNESRSQRMVDGISTENREMNFVCEASGLAGRAS